MITFGGIAFVVAQLWWIALLLSLLLGAACYSWWARWKP